MALNRRTASRATRRSLSAHHKPYARPTPTPTAPALPHPFESLTSYAGQPLTIALPSPLIVRAHSRPHLGAPPPSAPQYLPALFVTSLLPYQSRFALPALFSLLSSPRSSLFFSEDCALFSAMPPSQFFSYQSLPHCLDRDGGCTPPPPSRDEKPVTASPLDSALTNVLRPYVL